MNLKNLKTSILNAFGEITNNLVEKEIGKITQISENIITIIGLSRVYYNEALIVNDKYICFVAEIKKNLIKAVLLKKTNSIKINDEVKRTNKYIEVPVSDKLLGRIINPIGEPLDNKKSIKSYYKLPIERQSKKILDRKEINEPLETGIKIIDCFIPIGKGQRELLIGDKQTGKTSIAIDIILNQRNKNVICIYCAIGQKDSSIINTIDILKEQKALDWTIVVSASASSSAGMQYIAPFSATSIAEYFAEKGHSVLIIYDDLSKHAKSYREISLLLEKSPGREAYPADIFYLHSRLLERSINLTDLLGGGSITSIPIVETELGNISGYIPTNIISITDGQIYLSYDNFQKGFLPAIDIGKSVSRIGGKAQLEAYKQVAWQIKMEYSQYEDLEAFSQFSVKLNDSSEKILNKGRLIREFLKQEELNPISMEKQIILFLLINNDILNDINIKKVSLIEEKIFSNINNFKDTIQNIKNNKRISQKEIENIIEKMKLMISQNVF